MIAKRRSSAFLMEDYHLIGIEYLWRVILSGSEQMAFAAAELLIQTYTNLGPKLKNDVGLIHEDFVQECFDKLKIEDFPSEGPQCLVGMGHDPNVLHGALSACSL
ncbi:unnamed protein product, partial [Cyprideis torosa]